MKWRFPSLFSTLVAAWLGLGPGLLGADTPFEGRVEMLATGKREQTQMVYRVKGDRLRTEFQAPKSGETMVGILDFSKMEQIVLLPGQKAYMVVDLRQAMERAESRTRRETAVAPQRTGRKETIAGLEAEEFVVTEGRRKTEVWVTPKVGRFMASEGGPGGGGLSSLDSPTLRGFFREGNLFPLRVVSYDPRGREEGRLEVQSITRETQDESLFVPPPGYQPISLGLPGLLPGLAP